MAIVNDSMSSERTSNVSQASSSVVMEMEVVNDDDDDSEDEVCNEVVMPNAAALALGQTTAPTTINVEKSSNVHIGPHLNYNAPVTINQFVKIHNGDGSLEDLQQHAIKAPSFVNGFGPERNVQLDDNPTFVYRLATYIRRQLMWGCLILVILIVIIAAVVLNSTFSGSSKVDSSTWPPYITISPMDPPPDPTPDPTLVLNEGQCIYPRKFWSNYGPKFTRPLLHPTPYVVIAHSAEQACKDPINCSALLRGIQAYHVGEFDQPDIGFNFMIDSAGNVYEGRGWDSTNFVSDFVKRRNVGVCFIGNYLYLELNEKQQNSLQDLLALGVKLGKIAKDYKLIAHSQTFATESPGKNILQVIDSWPHRCLSDCVIPFNTIASTATESSTVSAMTTTNNLTTIWNAPG